MEINRYSWEVSTQGIQFITDVVMKTHWLNSENVTLEQKLTAVTQQ